MPRQLINAEKNYIKTLPHIPSLYANILIYFLRFGRDSNAILEENIHFHNTRIFLAKPV